MRTRYRIKSLNMYASGKPPEFAIQSIEPGQWWITIARGFHTYRDALDALKNLKASQ